MNCIDTPAREDVTAGTVGDDVLTVHELVTAGEGLGAKCGAGGLDTQAVEWLRAVNCPACLEAECRSKPGLGGWPSTALTRGPAGSTE
ncbi:hypothetical protein GCM10010211_62810 [Streptomyces albospinus]|uniref:Uncharacterized protein n=1 Tax=Streptomyces albospinus TaxID=285515 RepID=A0ABQ2VIU7_9ACTN|nr:hypothetical protein GCM10010211_62810 [Streptomyces albospinus]